MNSNIISKASYDEGFIRELQNMLRRIGRANRVNDMIIPENGIYDVSTENAVRTFQRIYSLDPSGEVDNITWDAIVNENNKVLRNTGDTAAIRPYPKYNGYELAEGERSELVFITQLMLNSVNLYYDLPRVAVNGLFDTQTRDAVAEFQRINMLSESGIIDRETWDRLAEDYNETVNDSQ